MLDNGSAARLMIDHKDDRKAASMAVFLKQFDRYGITRPGHFFGGNGFVRLVRAIAGHSPELHSEFTAC